MKGKRVYISQKEKEALEYCDKLLKSEWDYHNMRTKEFKMEEIANYGRSIQNLMRKAEAP